MPEAIKAQQLTKSFDDLVAVNHFDVTVEAGEIFGLVGPDGAGKTTTLRLLTSVLEPSWGDAWVAGRHTVREAEAVKESIGYMSQRFGLYLDLTVLENINFYADLFGVGRRERREATERLLEFTNLAPFTKRLAGNLSGGMKQKLGLACALIHTPKVLFLDEPTNGVDPVSRRDFWRILYQLLRDQVSIFVSTAYLDEAERCNRVGLIDRGRLLATGTPEELKTMMEGTILEIHCSRPRQGRALLQERLPTEQVGLFGDRIHVVTQNEQRASSSSREILLGAGIEVADIRPVEPTLEDVFISVLAREGQEHGDGQQ
jgi:ABC-2 type transport system ATP-binding protein